VTVLTGALTFQNFVFGSAQITPAVLSPPFLLHTSVTAAAAAEDGKVKEAERMFKKKIKKYYYNIIMAAAAEDGRLKRRKEFSINK